MAGRVKRPRFILKQGWIRQYSRLLTTVDATLLSLTAVFSLWLRFPLLSNGVTISISGGNQQLPYVWGLGVMVISWMILLALLGTRSPKTLGGGTREYSQVIQASITCLALSTTVLFSINSDFSRQVLFVFFGASIPLLIGGRWLCRRLLYKKREHGQWMNRAVLIGTHSQAEEMTEQFHARYQVGLEVAAICLTDEMRLDATLNVPIFVGAEQVRTALEQVNATELVVLEGSGLSPAKINDIAWRLDPVKHNLILAPAVTDVSGPRIHTRPVAGLPLLFLEIPSFHGIKRVAKRGMDIALASLACLLLLPVGLIIAFLIKFEDGGPVFFIQSRVGLNNRDFGMIKFRSMVQNADKLKASLKSDSEQGSPLFKMKDDPRISKVGKFLRTWSLDELPQLLNVLAGQMSLVGPRPPLRSEVNKYKPGVERKFLVKPGITGLWQVSGRSNLTWDESVRIDLFYVENWSLLTDLVILLRTANAVLKRDGAY